VQRGEVCIAYMGELRKISKNYLFLCTRGAYLFMLWFSIYTNSSNKLRYVVKQWHISYFPLAIRPVRTKLHVATSGANYYGLLCHNKKN
jgi:hypothetical protein